MKKRDIILSMLSGLLLVFSFPPFDLYFLAWAALVPLLLVLRGKAIRQAFLLGIITGSIYFAGTVYWVFHSMYYYGYIPAVMSILILVLLVLYLSLYTGLFSLSYCHVSRTSRLPALLVAPLIWVALEFVRTYAVTGFPWSSIGYSQYELLPIVQVADLTGVYGVSFLTVAANGAIADIFIFRKDRRRDEAVFPLAGLLLYMAVMAGVLFYGFATLQKEPPASKVRVSVIQGNIPQDKKWDAAFQDEVIKTYSRLSLAVAGREPELIVWPETAVPFIFGSDRVLTSEVVDLSKRLNTYLLFGSMLSRDNGQGVSGLANSAVVLSPRGDTVSVYDKMHLVPYGEYVPLRTLFPFIERITVGIGDFFRGKEPVVMDLPFAKIGNLICYEIIFPGLVRDFADRGAEVLVTITNDAWFGRTSAPYQHFSMAVFRAVENRRPVVRAANTGISGFIDSRGRVMSRSDIFVGTALTEEITPVSEKSFYTKNGDVFAYLCCAGALVLLLSSVLGKSKLSSRDL